MTIYIVMSGYNYYPNPSDVSAAFYGLEDALEYMETLSTNKTTYKQIVTTRLR